MGTAPKKHKVPVQATKLKVTATVTGLDTELATVGDAVSLIVEVDGQRFVAPISPKSFRKCQAAIKAGEPGTVMVLLTGELDLDAKQINAAGIVPMVKVPKPPKPDADGSGDAIAPTGDVSVPDAIAPADAAPPAAPPVPIVTIKKLRIPEPQG
ncbi:hypothetical protein [Propionivibrio sp.]|uniref:hypothetical protein n=1 Tax=Propionivibrio sp. TaxID=2212460 RepID=UPI003BF413E3